MVDSLTDSTRPMEEKQHTKIGTLSELAQVLKGAFVGSSCSSHGSIVRCDVSQEGGRSKAAKLILKTRFSIFSRTQPKAHRLICPSAYFVSSKNRRQGPKMHPKMGRLHRLHLARDPTPCPNQHRSRTVPGPSPKGPVRDTRAPGNLLLRFFLESQQTKTKSVNVCRAEKVFSGSGSGLGLNVFCIHCSVNSLKPKLGQERVHVGFEQLLDLRAVEDIML